MRISRSIFIIRHGEKPPPDTGIDVHGKENDHSLVPHGWQRAGALVTFFSGPRAALPQPTELIAPKYDAHASHERTHETIEPLAKMLELTPEATHKKGDEVALAHEVAAETSGVTLICWEHDHLPAIAQNIPTPTGTAIPATWPGNRFDVVWCFAREPENGKYAFSQVCQMLLHGDRDVPITN